MNDTRTDGAHPLLKAGERGRLDSWKKIAAHFNRDVTTVQRWERRENMPVHRHVHDKQGSVYAFRSELDAWWESRRGKFPDSGDAAPEPELLSSPPPVHSPPDSAKGPAEEAAAPEMGAPALGRMVSRPWGLAATIAAVLLLVYAALRFVYPAGETWPNPLANATVTRLTDWPGIEQAAEISRDGRWASFLADHDGRMDAWLTQIGSGSYRNLTRGDRIELVNPLDPHTRLLGRRLTRHRMERAAPMDRTPKISS